MGVRDFLGTTRGLWVVGIAIFVPFAAMGRAYFGFMMAFGAVLALVVLSLDEILFLALLVIVAAIVRVWV